MNVLVGVKCLNWHAKCYSNSQMFAFCELSSEESISVRTIHVYLTVNSMRSETLSTLIDSFYALTRANGCLKEMNLRETTNSSAFVILPSFPDEPRPDAQPTNGRFSVDGICDE